MNIPRELELEVVKNTVAHTLGKPPTFIFPPSENDANWHIILLTKTMGIVDQLKRGGFTRVQQVSTSKTSYIETYLVKFASYRQLNHPDIGRRIQFYDGGYGTVIDHRYNNEDLNYSQAWLILIDNGCHMSSGWYKNTQFDFVEEALAIGVPYSV